MDTNIQKYELSQNGKTYILSTQIENDLVKINCIETGTSAHPVYNQKYSLNDLKGLSTIFNNISTIIEAQEIINKTIENQKVSVEPLGNILNIVLYITKEQEYDNSYSIKMGLDSKGVIYNQPLVYHSTVQGPTSPVKELPRKVILTESEGTAKEIYSPVKRLPDTHISLPPEPTITAKEIYTNNDTYQNYQTQNYDNFNINTDIVETNNNSQIIDSTTLPVSNEQNYYYETQNQDYNNYFNEYQTSTQTETQYENYNIPTTISSQESNISNLPYSSPKREQIEYVIPGSPSTAQITYSSAPSHKNTIIETTKTTTTQEYNQVPQSQINMSSYNQKILELQTESSQLRGEYNVLKNESNKMSGEIGQLKGQVHLLLEENKILREKNGSFPNGAQIHEISFLKQEIDRLRKQLEQKLGIENTFEQYKQLKEQEIKYLKMQIEELMQRQNQQINNKESGDYLKQQQEKMTSETLKLQNTQLKVVKGEILKSTEELEFLTRKISNNHSKITLDLLYKATYDTDKASAFHNKCDWASNTLVLVETKNGRRFGGYTTCSWEGDCIEKKDEEAFVFSLDKMKIYNNIPGEEAIGCYPKYGPVFLGCQIRIYDEFFKNGGTTFEKGLNYNTEEDYELNGGEKTFDIKEVEVYGIKLH